MSTPQYILVDTVFRDGFVFRDNTGTAITGKVQADFTLALAKNGVGNQALTGITITEVDAVNNPGFYHINLGLTSFVDVVGEYHLAITYTADTKYAWEQVYVVAAGTSYITAGASFTSSASNGRVTDGASPVLGCLVVITDSVDAVVAAFHTDYLGNWGPAYFATDGTYTATAQQSGYASVSGTITVSGGVATGPGTDLVLGAAVASPLAASELWAYFTRQARDVVGDKAITERQQGVQDALDMVAQESKWNWLLRRGFVSLYGQVQISLVVTLGSDIATLTTGTFPTWAGTGKLFIQNQVIDIAQLVNTTTIRLATAWNRPTVSGQSAVLFKDSYTMPTNMLAFHQLIPGPRWGWGGVNIGPEAFYQNTSAAVFGQPIPACWCLHHGELLLYPYPSQDTQIAFTYYTRPANLTVSGDVADFDPALVNVIRRAIDVQVCIRYGSYAGGDIAHAQMEYRAALALGQEADKQSATFANAMDSVSPWDARLGRTMYQRRTYPPPSN